MTRKQKHLLARIVIAAILFFAGSLFYLPEYMEAGIFLSLYDTALRTLKEKSGGNKLPSMKALYAEKDRLVELRNRQREDFFNHRDYERELRTVSANIDMILKKNYEQLHDRKEPNL